MRHIEATIAGDDLALIRSEEGAGSVVWSLLKELGQLEDVVTIRIETGPRVVEPLERPEVALEFAGGDTIKLLRCVCGVETDTVEAMVDHLGKHGATRLYVRPMSYRRREKER